MKSTIQSVSDGTIVHMLTDRQGQKMAVKRKATSMPAPDANGMIESMQQTSDLKVLPDETLDGEAVYVLEATPKNTGTSTGKTLMYVAKNSGIVLKSVTMGQDGKPMSTITFSDIKMNEDIPASRFEFKAPEGVQVMDMTNQ